ncbi:hypothetical protein [uncultured Tateyamaria sp.]|nr:hypothetical protein [uncultured Tateyamaria sp.]
MGYDLSLPTTGTKADIDVSAITYPCRYRAAVFCMQNAIVWA